MTNEVGGERRRTGEMAPSGILVARSDGVYRALAARAFAPGERIARFEGETRSRPDRYSVQVGADRHLAVPPGCGFEEIMDRFPWRFLNHGCRPNTRVEGRDLVAATAIAARDELTFDYDTTEFELAEPFACRCGAPECRGTIRGHVHLAPAERARLAPTTAPHLVARRDDRIDLAR